MIGHLQIACCNKGGDQIQFVTFFILLSNTFYMHFITLNFQLSIINSS